MSLGRDIDDLIKTNIEIWHQAIQIKAKGKPKKNLSTLERAKIFRAIRALNSLRSKHRWKIDRVFGGINETKLNYYENKDA